MATATDTTIATTALYDKDALTGVDYNPAGSLYPDWRGLNYEGRRDTAEVAKLIRTELRKAIKAGALGSVTKASVRIDRFSMGSAIDVKLVVPRIYVGPDTPGAELRPVGSMYATPEWVIPNGRAVAGFVDKLLPDVYDAKTRVERFVSTFNRDGSNGAVDYWDVDFYSDVYLSEEVTP